MKKLTLAKSMPGEYHEYFGFCSSKRFGSPGFWYFDTVWKAFGKVTKMSRKHYRNSH